MEPQTHLTNAAHLWMSSHMPPQYHSVWCCNIFESCLLCVFFCIWQPIETNGLWKTEPTKKCVLLWTVVKGKAICYFHLQCTYRYVCCLVKPLVLLQAHWRGGDHRNQLNNLHGPRDHEKVTRWDTWDVNCSFLFCLWFFLVPTMGKIHSKEIPTDSHDFPLLATKNWIWTRGGKWDRTIVHAGGGALTF